MCLCLRPRKLSALAARPAFSFILIISLASGTSWVFCRYRSLTALGIRSCSAFSPFVLSLALSPCVKADSVLMRAPGRAPRPAPHAQTQTLSPRLASLTALDHRVFRPSILSYRPARPHTTTECSSSSVRPSPLSADHSGQCADPRRIAGLTAPSSRWRWRWRPPCAPNATRNSSSHTLGCSSPWCGSIC
jgi:hypothetical protein